MSRRSTIQRATPEWPCPRCGHEGYEVTEHTTPPCLWPAVCRHCGLLLDRHWVDGCWMGRHWEDGRGIESLSDFIDRRAEELRG